MKTQNENVSKEIVAIADPIFMFNPISIKIAEAAAKVGKIIIKREEYL